MSNDSGTPLSRSPVVAVVGATGVVGGVLLRVLAEHAFPVRELRPLAGPRSVGLAVPYAGRDWRVAEALPEAFDGVDLVFFAATGALSRTLAPEALRRGARVIDKSATWRLEPEVPLVVPGVNGERVTAETRLVACPNCTTIGLVMALEPIRRAAGLERVTVTTLQAASGAGRDGLEELVAGEAARARGEEPRARTFPAVLAGNALPLCGEEEADGATTEERKLVLETRKILGLPELSIAATCTRVPVPVGHAASITLTTTEPLDPKGARRALEEFPGVRVVAAPTPADVAGTDEVLVGRIRTPLDGVGLQLWQVADNLRRGAATNAVEIAELWLER